VGVGAGLCMYDVVVKKFTFAISSPDEFLVIARQHSTAVQSAIKYSNSVRLSVRHALVLSYKCLAVAEMGNCLAITDGSKNGGGLLYPILWGAESPPNTMSPGPKPTSVPSGILIHPTVWPQYTNVMRQTDRQTG